MATALVEPETRCETLADLLERLGNIPPDRVLLHPWPGTATEEDLLRLPKDVRRMCELIDGTLVVKAMGYPESVLAMVLVGFLREFLRGKKLAAVSGPDGHIRFFGDQVRMPDVAVLLRDKLPDGELPTEQICPIAPDLAVEVLSPGNTKKEMKRRVREFFDSGVRLVWILDPKKRKVRVYTSPDDDTEFKEDGTLDGGDVLPGFTVSIEEWFAEAK